jgi:peroxiredoxin Q/BCP
MAKNKLTVGDRIPEFKLENQDSKLIKISPNDGKKRIIYFYPKDDTKVCTEQACSFRDWQEELTEKGFEVIGISSDKPKSHLKFKTKYNLNFQLLSDRKGKVKKLFGLRNFMGMLPSRKTFLIDKDGEVVFAYEALLQGNEHIKKMKEFIENNNL